MKTYTVKQSFDALKASIEARLRFDRADYWDRQIARWSDRLSVAVENQCLSQGEIKAILDAAGNMRDDFEDYYSFLGPKRVKIHVANYNSAMDKLKNAIV